MIIKIVIVKEFIKVFKKLIINNYLNVSIKTNYKK